MKASTRRHWSSDEACSGSMLSSPKDTRTLRMGRFVIQVSKSLSTFPQGDGRQRDRKSAKSGGVTGFGTRGRALGADEFAAVDFQFEQCDSELDREFAEFDLIAVRCTLEHHGHHVCAGHRTPRKLPT